jgi:nitronate monooxygenase
MSLLPQIVDAVGATVPVIAAGGISDARSVYASFILGADTACLGTLFMLTKETKLPDYHRNALLSASPEATQLTRAFTGRYARGITNRFMDTMHQKCIKEDDIPDYDIHSARTPDIFAKAKAVGKADEYCNMWAGQSFGIGRAFTNNGTLSAAETIQKLVDGVENLSKQSFSQQ